MVDLEEMPDIRVMIVDDHEVVRRGIVEVVDRADGMAVVAEAGSVEEATRRADLIKPDIILVDLRLPDGTGIDIMRWLDKAGFNTRSIVLTSFDDDEAMADALDAGAAAFLLKTVRGADITDTIREVMAGETPLNSRVVQRRLANNPDPTVNLTPTERRVLDLIGEGLSNREIAEHLGVAEKTIKNHVTSLLDKMGLRRRTQVAAWVAAKRSSNWRNL